MAKLTQASFSKGAISAKLFGRIDSKMYQEAAEELSNMIVHSFGGASNRSGMAHIAPIKDHTDEETILRRFQFSTSDQYMLIFGDLYMWVIRNDGLVLHNADTIEGMTLGASTLIDLTAHTFSVNEIVYISGITTGPTELNGLICVVSVDATNEITLVRQDTGEAIDSTGLTAWSAGGTISQVFELTTPYISADLKNLVFTQENDTVTITHSGYVTNDLTRTDHDTWSLTAVAFLPDQAAPTNPSITVNSGSGSNVAYAVTAINADSQEESLPLEDTDANSGLPGAIDNTFSWDGATGAARYSIYRKQNGLYGFLGQTELTTFEDDDITADLTLSPPTARDPLGSATEYPQASGYFEQRQVYGGNTLKPDTTYFSKIGARRNMTISFPLQDNDAITATLNGTEINSIKHFVTLEDLIVFTAFQEWRISQGSDRGLTHETIRAKPQTDHGVDYLAPEVVGRTILFISKGRARCYALKFDFNTGVGGGYDSQDLNELSDHIWAEDGPDEHLCVDFCFASFPEPRAHYVRSDGKACTMTYNEAAAVVAWTVWDTPGATGIDLFEHCEVLKRQISDVEDGVYWIVKRTFNGNVVRNVEKNHTRKFANILDSKFLDSSLLYDVPIVISDVDFSSGEIVVTTESAHGLAEGDEVFLRDIVWTALVDEDGNETQPDQLNGRSFIIQAVTPTTFKLQCPLGGAQT